MFLELNKNKNDNNICAYGFDDPIMKMLFSLSP
jgi:hypothetical protein